MFRTVRGRMLFWTLAVTVPIYAFALYMSYQATARQLEAGAERDVKELVAQLAIGLDSVIRPIEGGIRTVAGQLEEVDPPPEQYPARIRGILAAWPDVYGSTIAVEIGDAGPSEKPFAPYLFRREGAIAYSDLALDSYAYQDLAWYRRAADEQQPVWSLPYFDAGGGETWMVTYSVPFYRNRADRGRVFAGVVTADLDLNWMKRVAHDVTLGSSGVGWLSSPAGTQPFTAPIGATPDRLPQFTPTLNADLVRDIAEKMLARKSSFEPLPDGVVSQPAYLAVRKLETLDWRVMFVIPRSHLLAEARALLNRQLWLGAGGLLLLVAAISVVAAGISRPLHNLAESVGTASEDDPDFRLPEDPRRDEIGVLTQALRRMRDSLRKHIQLRAETLAEQARVEHELQIAASIQQSMLPRHDPRTFPATAQVAAALLPARQVGGDLYDYFHVVDGNVLFAIGDVSDKGIPAALFMARLSALLRVLGASGEVPDRLLCGINERLVDGNDACMFVTLGCGLLNIHTGQIRYASAGHDAPLVRRLEGTVAALAADNGPAIGIDASVEYPTIERYLAPGDTLILFTDGVTEAEARDQSLFGLDRLTALMQNSPDGEPATLVQQILNTVAEHTGDIHASDDLTVLALALKPPRITAGWNALGPHWLIEPEISATGVEHAKVWLRAILLSRDIAQEICGDVELIAEELLTNVFRAVGSRAEARVSIHCTLTVEEVVLTLRDDGEPFDPLAHARPDLDADIADREIGGLGIELVRQLSDQCRYSRVDDYNILEVRLPRARPR